ncbi:MAG: hypothetical protein WCJ56_13710 [bacterium]
MYYLQNDCMKVSILDPVADVALLGSRYVTGGYIWQITGADGVELLSGPDYPNTAPDPFLGQGLPEAFETALGATEAAVGGELLVIGVGKVQRATAAPYHPRNSPTVSEFARWDITVDDCQISMQTTQRFKEYMLTISREVMLQDNKLHSVTHVWNVGNSDLPIRWFPHPFFPHPADQQFCKFAPAVTLPENPGYALNEGMICGKAGYDWSKGGCFQQLVVPENTGLTTTFLHPHVGQIKMTADYPVTELPIWGNHITFSAEPYLNETISPGAMLGWSLGYNW